MFKVESKPVHSSEIPQELGRVRKLSGPLGTVQNEGNICKLKSTIPYSGPVILKDYIFFILGKMTLVDSGSVPKS